MRFADVCALLVACLFVLLVMAMLRIKQVCKFSNFVLLVNESNFDIMQVGVMELLLKLVEGMLELLTKVGRSLGIWLTTWLGDTGCHGRRVVRLDLLHVLRRVKKESRFGSSI